MDIVSYFIEEVALIPIIAINNEKEVVIIRDILIPEKDIIACIIIY